MRRAALCVLAAVATAGCLRATEFRCLRDTDCGASGTCEPIGYCSVPNAGCAGTGRSFTDSAGQNLSNTCVAVDNPAIDAGVDAAIDGMIGRCPGDYAAVAASSHVYKLLTNVSWDAARNACAQSTPAYLAVPDDAPELANLASVATAPFWVGLDDNDTEGTFVTQKGVAAGFLPWLATEPDNGPPEENCVNAVSATEIATERCGTKRAAVCECEP